MAPTSAELLFAAMIALLGTQVLTKKEKVYYLSLERIKLPYWNPKYYKFANITTKRYSRKDPMHYINLHGEILVPFGNNVTVDGYMYEFLSNEYRRSFVEIHIGLCDFLFQEKTFSPFMNNYFAECPLRAGVYKVENISFPNVPFLKTFPFTKGRIYGNASVRGTGERIANIYVDAEVKERWVKT